MSNHANSHPDQDAADTSQDVVSKPRGFWRSTAGLVTIAFFVIGGFLLLAEHRAHLVPLIGYSLPLLLLLACLPMHLFTHGRHRGERDPTESDQDASRRRH